MVSDAAGWSRGLARRRRSAAAPGDIFTVAGNCTAGFTGDGGLATAAELNGARGVAALPGGGFLIADSFNERIRLVSPSGVITTVAGNGTPGTRGTAGPRRPPS